MPAELDEVILRCLNRDARARYADAGELRTGCARSGRRTLQAAQKGGCSRTARRLRTERVLDVLRESRSRSVPVENRANNRLPDQACLWTQEGLAEARLLASHPHPHIVHIHGVSSNDRAFIIVMEYLAGGSLRDRMARVMPWRKALPIVRDVCAALVHAHRHEVLHGNLRPANILFSSTNEVKVSDFGLVEPDADQGAARYQRTGHARTREGDLYAVGVMLHELLLGSPPVFREGLPVADAGLKLLPADVQRLVIRFLATGSAQFAEFGGAAHARPGARRHAGGRNQFTAQACPAPALLWLAAGAIALIAGGWFAGWPVEPARRRCGCVV